MKTRSRTSNKPRRNYCSMFALDTGDEQDQDQGTTERKKKTTEEDGTAISKDPETLNTDMKEPVFSSRRIPTSTPDNIEETAATAAKATKDSTEKVCNAAHQEPPNNSMPTSTPLTDESCDVGKCIIERPTFEMDRAAYESLLSSREKKRLKKLMALRQGQVKEAVKWIEIPSFHPGRKSTAFRPKISCPAPGEQSKKRSIEAGYLLGIDSDSSTMCPTGRREMNGSPTDAYIDFSLGSNTPEKPSDFCSPVKLVDTSGSETTDVLSHSLLSLGPNTRQHGQQKRQKTQRELQEIAQKMPPAAPQVERRMSSTAMKVLQGNGEDVPFLPVITEQAPTSNSTIHLLGEQQLPSVRKFLSPHPCTYATENQSSTLQNPSFVNRLHNNRMTFPIPTSTGSNYKWRSAQCSAFAEVDPGQMHLLSDAELLCSLFPAEEYQGNNERNRSQKNT